MVPRPRRRLRRAGREQRLRGALRPEFDVGIPCWPHVPHGGLPLGVASSLSDASVVGLNVLHGLLGGHRAHMMWGPLAPHAGLPRGAIPCWSLPWLAASLLVV